MAGTVCVHPSFCGIADKKKSLLFFHCNDAVVLISHPGKAELFYEQRWPKDPQ